MIFLYIFIFIGAALLLVRSGTWVVQSLSRIAGLLSWSEFVVAFVLIALFSSLPEFFIGISSVLHGIPEVSFGNIIGANVVNLTLAVGLAVLFLGGLPVERKIVKRDSLFTGISALLPLVLIFDGELSRIDGLVLISSFILYGSWLFSQKDRFSRIYNNANHGLREFLKDIFLFLGSIVLMFLSAELIIWSVISFAKIMNLPLAIIGVLLVGIGTALPEVYFSIKSALHGKKEVILGNLMGCIVVTSLLVLGIVSLLSPIKIADFSPYFIARIFLMIAAVSFMVFIRTHEKITKKEAFFLIFVYLAFVAAELLLK